MKYCRKRYTHTHSTDTMSSWFDHNTYHHHKNHQNIKSLFHQVQESVIFLTPTGGAVCGVLPDTETVLTVLTGQRTKSNILKISGSGPVSLAESMQMVDEILANGNLDRMDRIEKLENILSAATSLSTPSPQPQTRPIMVDSETQTLSTGDIVITKVFFPEGHQPSSQVKKPSSSSLYKMTHL